MFESTLKQFGRKRAKRTTLALLALLVSVSGTFYPARRVHAASCVLQGNTITVDCEFAPDTYYYTGTLTIDPLVTVTAGSQSSPGIVYIYADDIVVNGTISANAMGSAGGAGTCPGSGGTTGGGGCHSGFGGRSSGNVVGGSNAYGFAEVPTNVGSGGGDDTDVGGTQGGRGGGAVWIGTYSATGTLAFGTLGAITANGQNGVSNEAGGGAGGTVYIDVGIIDVQDGFISANGGNGAGSGTTGGGGGGGGMVTVRYNSTTGIFTQSRQAFGGNRGTTTGLQARAGGPGTIYTKDLDDDIRVLTVQNDKTDPSFTRTEMVNSVNTFNLLGGAKFIIDDQLEVDDTFTYTNLGGNVPELWIRNGYFGAPDEAMTFSGINIHQTGLISGLRYMTFNAGTYSVDPTSALFSSGRGNRLESLVLSGTNSTTYSATGTGTFYADLFQAKSGAYVTHATNTTTFQHSLNISATSTLDIQSGASVNVNARGYSGNITVGGAGFGPGASPAGSGNGAGYGGNGGFGLSGAVGSTYGSVTQPTDIGSGGSAFSSSFAVGSGAGGGAVKLAAPSGTVNISGTVTANGGPQTNVDSSGSGGSIWIDAGSLSGSGTLNANGGVVTAGNASGSGGGGRIAIYYDSVSGSLTRTAFGGSAVQNKYGGAGTIFIDDKDDALANGSLIVDNNNLTGTAYTTQTCTPSCNQTYDEITITKAAHYRVPVPMTLTLAAGGTLAGGGTQQADLTINAGGSFTPTGATSFTFNDLDVINAGTLNTVTQLTIASASFTESGTGTHAAGVTDLILNAGTYTKATAYTGLNLSTLTVPNGSTFNNNSSAYYPFLSTFTDLTVYGTFSQGTTNKLFVDELIVQNGGTVTHAAETDGTQSVGLDISATTSVYVHVGGSISANGRGFPKETGPGAATTCSFGACRGGAHAGAGGLGSFGSGGTTMYGSVTAPTTLGSGGGGDSGIAAGLGGGFIRIAAPSLTAAGTISSNGSQSTASSGGGGAGGSVRIDVTTLAGGGTISANGGAGATASGQNTGGGGGGRVALYYTTDSGTSTRTAYPGLDGVNGTSGGAGTVFVDDVDDANADGTLIVDGNNLSNAGNTQTTCLPDCIETYGNITISRGARYVIAANTTLTLAAGGTLTGGGTNRPRITVNAGGTFNPNQAAFSYNALDLVVSGTVGTATAITLNEAGLTMSGTGTFANPVTTLNLNGFSTVVQGSASPNLNLTSLDVPALGSVTMSANAYYPFGANFATLNVTGTYVNGTVSTLFLNVLNVNQGGLVTHATQTGGTQNVSLTVSATSSINVATGGSISVAGRGFPTATGPGSASTCSFGACRGASHGGLGGVGSFGSGGTTIYGSVKQPTAHGSGGGNDTGIVAGLGGGTMKLVTQGTVTAAGTISAAGTNGPSAGGGGSGGSLWIDAGTITGGGTISVNGGNGGTSSGQSTGGGGGGRMALYYATDSGTGTRSAAGGTDGGNGTIGGGGTIYLDDTDDALANGTLRVGNGGQSNDSSTTQTSGSSETYDIIDIRDGAEYIVPSGATLALASGGSLTGSGSTKGTLTISSGGVFNGGSATLSATGLNMTNNGSFSTTTSFTFGNGTYLNNGTFTAGLTTLVVGSGANWRQQISAQLFSGSDLTIQNGGTFTQEHTNTIVVDTVTIESGGTLTHCDNTTAKTCEVDFTSTTFTIEAGGTVNADAKGFDSTTGDGQGGDAQAGGGAGYGGDGGDGVVSSVNQNNNGVLYGSATGPVDLGSGGGDDTGSTNQQGGAGGGVIRLLISGTLTVDGPISADGQAGTANEGGGGSGGSIWLSVSVLDATANIGADGGAGSGTNTTGGGCGAGGRIAIDYDNGSYTQTATTTAAAGTGCTGVRVASTGSVYLNELPDNAPTVNGITHSPAAPTVTDDVTISASATYATGLDKIELYLDGTTAPFLRHTCDFTAVTDGSCSIHVGLLSRGTHTTTVKAYGDDLSVSVDAESFYVDGSTTGNSTGLSRLKVGALATFTLTYTLSGTSTQDLVVTFPGGFTVQSAFTSGSACLSNFNFTSTTLTADTTDCIGTVTATGATVTNPSTPGVYVISWVDDEGETAVAIVDDDQVNVSAAVDASITFNVGAQTAACDGTYSGNGGAVAFGTVTTSSVSTSDVGGIAHICTRVSTNAGNGTTVTVRSSTGSLRSIAAPSDEILSTTSSLVAGTEGYGLCVGSGGGDTGVDGLGASPTAQAPFNGACSTGSHAVGGLTTSPQTVWSVAGPAQNAFARLFLKAAVATDTVAHNDYADTLTFIATGTY